MHVLWKMNIFFFFMIMSMNRLFNLYRYTLQSYNFYPEDRQNHLFEYFRDSVFESQLFFQFYVYTFWLIAFDSILIGHLEKNK